MPKCSICKQEEVSEVIKVCGKEYPVCFYDAKKALDFLEGGEAGHVANILWGAGRVDWNNWYALRTFLRANNITEVLEIGCGLSSELFVNEGLKLIGFDTLINHVNVLKGMKPMQPYATFHWYDYMTPPPVQELYPERKWDFVFVDGPHERSKEVRVAMEVSSKFIMLHDPNLGEQSFFPDNNWKPTALDRCYERIK